MSLEDTSSSGLMWLSGQMMLYIADVIGSKPLPGGLTYSKNPDKCLSIAFGVCREQ